MSMNLVIDKNCRCFFALIRKLRMMTEQLDHWNHNIKVSMSAYLKYFNKFGCARVMPWFSVAFSIVH